MTGSGATGSGAGARTTALAAAQAELAAAGVASPRVDAELLLAQVLGTDRTRLLLASGLTAAEAAQFSALVAKRACRVPLQHLTGTAYFRYLELAVGPGVFVPRPETELVAQSVVDELVRLDPRRRRPAGGTRSRPAGPRRPALPVVHR